VTLRSVRTIIPQIPTVPRASQQTNITAGGITVQVHSAPSMSPSEVERRVERATGKALRRIVEEAYVGRRPLVQGAP